MNVMARIVVAAGASALAGCSVDHSQTADPTQVPTASALQCAEGEVVEWREGGWACSSPAPFAAFGRCDGTDEVAGVDPASGAVICEADVDTDRDSLGALECGDGQVIKWIDARWACADDADTDLDTDSLARVEGCQPGEALGWHDGTWACGPLAVEDWGRFGSCDAGQKVVGVDAGTGTVICEPDADSLLADDLAQCSEGATLERGEDVWRCGPPPPDLAPLAQALEDARGGEPRLADRVTAVLDRLEALEQAHCPARFAYAPADGFDVCQRDVSGATDQMVKVGDFWIDRYEMSACPGGVLPDDLGGPTGGSEVEGSTRTTAAACSVAGAAPLVSITWFQASQMCANAGKHLCTNLEWQTAASGTPDAADDGGAAGCVVDENQAEPTGTHTDCVSRFGAFDMGGNVWEWVSEWYGMDSSGGSVGQPLTFGSDAADDVRAASFQDNAGQGTSFPAAGLRGGDWESGAGGGVFALSYEASPSAADGHYGARCCAGGS